jgi:phosphoglycolate phosphatase-like HAD superfamily hydrolase
LTKSFNLSQAKSIIFDCDGVILNSNFIKLNAFKKIAESFGSEIFQMYSQAVMDRNLKTRFERFECLSSIICDVSCNVDKHQLTNGLLKKFAETMQFELMDCDVTPQLCKLKNFYSNATWFVVSAALEKELQDIFYRRDLRKYFEGGVYGGPKNKYEIIHDLLCENKLLYPVVLVGDHTSDYEVARYYNFEFIYISEWSADSGFINKFPDETTFKYVSDLIPGIV